VRIIGGRWRGRKLTFTPADGLRPTGDRIRETLFNWLAPYIAGARCADLFAGSGALGLEALSRKAAHCDFVDNSRAAITQIAEHLETLAARDLGTCHQVSAQQFLLEAREPYDIVFIDPPFANALVAPVAALLAQTSLLADDALIYIEMAAVEPAPELPSGWSVHREKKSGGVAYRLLNAGTARIKT
jgi:16S rRNA (guanine966-N2)-methyltransferase